MGLRGEMFQVLKIHRKIYNKSNINEKLFSHINNYYDALITD